jgi:hypothetical protein
MDLLWSDWTEVQPYNIDRSSGTLQKEPKALNVLIKS